jgi:signal transduction histidine kinase
VSAVQVLEDLQLAAFVVLGLAAVRLWWRDRSQPAAHLAGAFGVLAAVLAVARIAEAVGPPAPGAGLELLLVAGMVAFPLLLVAFAWSFEPVSPRWLPAAAVAAVTMLVWFVLIGPLPEDAVRRSPAQDVFVVTFLLLWSALMVAAAWRLWRAGGAQRLVRARMRLLATGALTLTAALILTAGVGGGEGAHVTVGVIVLSVVAAGLFVLGFAPPTPLRQFWRRRATRQWQTMQADLIRAATRTEVAAAVAPLVADTLGGAVVIVGADGAVLARVGLDPEEAQRIARGLVAARASPGEHAASSTNTLDHVVAGDGAWLVVHSTPYTPLLGDDEAVMVEAFALQLRLALERAELLDEARRAQEDAERARADLEATLAGLSHDLRSPATAITGFAALLPRARDDAHRAEMVAQIADAAAYLHRLVDALLDLSRIGRTQTDVEPVDLGRVVGTVARRMEVVHPRARVLVREPLPIVLMNPARAEQLFDNLLGNAAKHGGREDVTITVEARRRDELVELTVSDDGQGIGTADPDELFTLFGRGRSSASGSGVGLNLVRRIVEAYGGDIELVPSDGGARFEIRLPEPGDHLTSARGEG